MERRPLPKCCAALGRPTLIPNVPPRHALTRIVSPLESKRKKRVSQLAGYYLCAISIKRDEKAFLDDELIRMFSTFLDCKAPDFFRELQHSTQLVWLSCVLIQH